MSLLHDWYSFTPAGRHAAIATLLHGGWPPATEYIDLVRAAGDWGVYASTGPHFTYAIFGRDSLETAEDLLEMYPELTHNIMVSLARLQGVSTNALSEEEPGKIHHEYRSASFGGEIVPEHSLEILHALQQVWGGEGTDHMVYYGSHDATLLYIRLIGRYVEHYGSGILAETFTGRDQQTHTIADSVVAALVWTVRKTEGSLFQLFTYKRLNPNGIVNQAWKDSATGYLHLNGSLPNFEHGIASVELQGYAYDALQTGYHLGLGSAAQRDHWQQLAGLVQTRTLDMLWLPGEHYFAQGLDVDDHGQPRQIATLTSNAGVLLDSRLLHDLPPEQAAPYVQGIVRALCSPELLTPVGIRCRARKHWDLIHFIDYHGPNSVWPKETFDIAKGLRRAKLPHLAAMLEARIASSLEIAGEFYEFFYVSRDERVWYDRAAAFEHFGAESPGQMVPVPEPGQAWTIAAANRIVYEQAQRGSQPLPPASPLEQELLASIPPIPRPTSN